MSLTERIARGAQKAQRGAAILREQMSTGARSGAQRVRSGARRTGDRVVTGAESGAQRVARGTQQVASEARDRAEGGAERVADNVRRDAETAAEVTRDAAATARDAGERTGERAADTHGEARDRAETAVRETVDRAVTTGRDVVAGSSPDTGFTGAADVMTGEQSHREFLAAEDQRWVAAADEAGHSISDTVTPRVGEPARQMGRMVSPAGMAMFGEDAARWSADSIATRRPMAGPGGTGLIGTVPDQDRQADDAETFRDDVFEPTHDYVEEHVDRGQPDVAVLGIAGALGGMVIGGPARSPRSGRAPDSPRSDTASPRAVDAAPDTTGALGSPDPTLPGERPGVWDRSMWDEARQIDRSEPADAPSQRRVTGEDPVSETGRQATGGDASGLPMFDQISEAGGVRRWRDRVDEFVADEHAQLGAGATRGRARSRDPDRGAQRDTTGRTRPDGTRELLEGGPRDRASQQLQQDMLQQRRTVSQDVGAAQPGTPYGARDPGVSRQDMLTFRPDEAETPGVDAGRTVESGSAADTAATDLPATTLTVDRGRLAATGTPGIMQDELDRVDQAQTSSVSMGRDEGVSGASALLAIRGQEQDSTGLGAGMELPRSDQVGGLLHGTSPRGHVDEAVAGTGAGPRDATNVSDQTGIGITPVLRSDTRQGDRAATRQAQDTDTPSTRAPDRPPGRDGRGGGRDGRRGRGRRQGGRRRPIPIPLLDDADDDDEWWEDGEGVTPYRNPIVGGPEAFDVAFGIGDSGDREDRDSDFMTGLRI